MSTKETTRPAPTLGLSPERIALRYSALQAKLVPLWKSIASLNRDPQTIVVVPSITLESLNMAPAVLQAMEERRSGPSTGSRPSPPSIRCLRRSAMARRVADSVKSSRSMWSRI